MRLVFFLLGAAALAVLLQRPLCIAAHGKQHAGERASCCRVIGATSAAKALDLAIPLGIPPLVPPAGFAYLLAATLFLAGVTRLARRAPVPPRSYYARSARILR